MTKNALHAPLISNVFQPDKACCNTNSKMFPPSVGKLNVAQRIRFKFDKEQHYALETGLIAPKSTHLKLRYNAASRMSAF